MRVESKQVERCAEALGREVADDERAVAETVPSPAPRMYLGLDGSGVPVRPAEVEGRGKQPDGSAKTREVKLATVWTAETPPEVRECIHYVFGNRHRMRYPQFRAKGLCISPGVVEAGCKQNRRTAQARRTHWTVAGAKPSSPRAAASSVAASRTSGSDEPKDTA